MVKPFKLNNKESFDAYKAGVLQRGFWKPSHVEEPVTYPAYVRSFYDASIHEYRHVFTYERQIEVVVDWNSLEGQWVTRVQNNGLSFEVKMPPHSTLSAHENYAEHVKKCLETKDNKDDQKDAERYRFIRNATLSELKKLMIHSLILPSGGALDRAVDEFLS